MSILLFLHLPPSLFFFFFFNDTATTEIYTLSLHDALPICLLDARKVAALDEVGDQLGVEHDLDGRHAAAVHGAHQALGDHADRKSTRLNSSHGYISYAVFCLKKKKRMTCIE